MGENVSPVADSRNGGNLKEQRCRIWLLRDPDPRTINSKRLMINLITERYQMTVQQVCLLAHNTGMSGFLEIKGFIVTPFGFPSVTCDAFPSHNSFYSNDLTLEGGRFTFRGNYDVNDWHSLFYMSKVGDEYF